MGVYTASQAAQQQEEEETQKKVINKEADVNTAESRPVFNKEPSVTLTTNPPSALKFAAWRKSDAPIRH